MDVTRGLCVHSAYPCSGQNTPGDTPKQGHVRAPGTLLGQSQPCEESWTSFKARAGAPGSETMTVSTIAPMQITSMLCKPLLGIRKQSIHSQHFEESRKRSRAYTSDDIARSCQILHLGPERSRRYVITLFELRNALTFILNTNGARNPLVYGIHPKRRSHKGSI